MFCVSCTVHTVTVHTYRSFQNNNSFSQFNLCMGYLSNRKRFLCLHSLIYPGPRGFSWFFFAKEIKSKPRSGDKELRKRRGEREKPLVTLASNLTFMQMTGSGSDPRELIGWYFFKHANQFDCFVPRERWRFLHLISEGKFCLSLPGKKIVCILHSQ